MPAADLVFKALANRRRIAILTYLKIHPSTSVLTLSDAIHLSFRSTSRHLQVLRAAALVEPRRRWREVHYHRCPLPRALITTFVRMME